MSVTALTNPAFTRIFANTTDLKSQEGAASNVFVAATAQDGVTPSANQIELWYPELAGSMSNAGVLTGGRVITLNPGEKFNLTGRNVNSGFGKIRELWGRAVTGAATLRWEILGT